MKTIVCYNPEPPTEKDNGRAFSSINKPAAISVYVPAESVEAYKTNATWKQFNILPLNEIAASAPLVEKGSPETSPVYYDFHGRRVLNPRSGKLYIVDGKKMVWK